MADIRYINISHEGATNTLAVGSGMSASELEGVIRSIFSVKGAVVGFQAQVRPSAPRTLRHIILIGYLC